MKNEEKAKELADYYAGETDYKECGAYDAALAMAQWKDEQFKAEKQALIDKACEWLKENVSKHCHGYYTFHKGLMIEEFKQAMKGGEQ